MEPTAEPTAPDEIGRDLVATLVPELVSVEIGSELVLVGGATRSLVVNPSGALLLQLFDGETPLGNLIDEISDDLAADHDVVERDVLAFARELGRNGFLSGVSTPEPVWPEWESSPEVALQVGDHVDDFTLPDLDGELRSLSEFRGRHVVLVNWSPDCGYCLNIVDALAAEEVAMRDRGTELVFLTLGGSETNRAVMQGAGVRSPVLVRDGTDVDPFAGAGTPSALHLDEAGSLLEPMVVGADRVPDLVAVLGRGDAESDARDLPAPSGICAPGAVGSAGQANSTSWLRTIAFRFGEVHVGLRVDSEETADTLARLFPGALVADDRVPINYSVALPGASDGGVRGLNLLVHGSSQRVRSRSPARVLAALLAHLSSDLDGTDPHLCAVDATAALCGDEAVLLPGQLVGGLTVLQPRLARLGIRFVDVARPTIDLSTCEVVVSEPSIEHDPSVLAGLDGPLAAGAELPRVRPGRYPLTTWFFLGSSEQVHELTAAVGAVAALALLDLPDDAPAAVRRLGEMFGTVRARSLWPMNADQLATEVATAAGS